MTSKCGCPGALFTVDTNRVFTSASLASPSRREPVEHRLSDQRHTPVGAPETLRVELRVLAHHEAVWNLSLAADDGAGQPGVAADVRVRKDHRLADRRTGVNPRAGEQERAADRAAGDDAAVGQKRGDREPPRRTDSAKELK